MVVRRPWADSHARGWLANGPSCDGGCKAYPCLEISGEACPTGPSGQRRRLRRGLRRVVNPAMIATQATERGPRRGPRGHSPWGRIGTHLCILEEYETQAELHLPMKTRGARMEESRRGRLCSVSDRWSLDILGAFVPCEALCLLLWFSFCTCVAFSPWPL